MRNKKKAVVLLSGGLDSATALYLARKQGYQTNCLIFDYNQRHQKEVNAARKIARVLNCKFQALKIAFPWKGSALLDSKLTMPSGGRLLANKIPSTYVPARNLIFLSFALAYAETIGAGAIFIGAHTQDYSGYPDCRPEFFRAFDKVASLGTKAGAGNKKIRIKAPLLNKTKAEIVRLAVGLKVPFELTWSCYRGGKTPCGKCDSCCYRAKGFQEAGIEDRFDDR